MRFAVIANPDNRRWVFFRDAARSAGHEARVISWLDALEGSFSIDDDEIVRVESYGEDWDVESTLLGVREPEDRGRIRGLGTAYERFSAFLNELPERRFMIEPAEICAMFDKVATKARLRAAGVDTPRDIGTVRTFDELRSVMRDAPRHRAFVKPRHGSSASGVIALSMHGDRVAATTSVERDGEKLYNSLKIRKYRTMDVLQPIVDLLGMEDELLVEEWVPKASAQDGAFDVRIVPIAGRAEHAVMRVGRSPMTNLHLGNARGDLDKLRARLDDRWDAILEAAERSVAAFPGALYAGVDVAITPNLARIVVFEVNAFGDLLPHIENARGESTYEAEVRAFTVRGTGKSL